MVLELRNRALPPGNVGRREFVERFFTPPFFLNGDGRPFKFFGFMKAVFRLLACMTLAMGGAMASAQSPLSKLERVQFLGRDYVRLTDWARANSFQVTWLKKDKVVRLANGSFTLVFTGGSCEARINGINLWLSYPVAVRGGKGYVALLDMQTAIMPVVFPAKSPGKIALVALDPGHGGKDKGFHQGSHHEKEYTLLFAQELRAQLNRAGIKTTLTRTTDVSVDLSARTDLARRRGADVFVSLHFNSVGRGKDEAKGVEVFCLTPAGARSTNVRGVNADTRSVRGNRYNDQSALLAYQLQRALVTNLGSEDRGVRRARFEVLRTAAMPAVLVEAGFLSHPSEGRKILDPAHRRQMAQALVKGLLEYKRLVEE